MSLPINNLNINNNLIYKTKNNNDKKTNKQTQSFGGAADVLTTALKWCDTNPVGGVIAIDTLSTNIPRTYVDLKTTGPAAAIETMRREFSGTFVDCIMPGFIVLGAGKLLNSSFMKKFSTDMTSSWASEEALDKLSSIYKTTKISSSAENMTKDFVTNTLKKLEGFDADTWIKFSDKIPEKTMKDIIAKLTKVIDDDKLSSKETKKVLKDVYKTITDETNCSNALKFIGDKDKYGSNLSDLLRDIVDLGRKFKNEKVSSNLEDFVKKSKKMLSAKSIIGLLITMPIAMSMQEINRYLTRKKYNIEGAPIYKDFENGNSNHKKMDEKEKKQFFVEKIIASIGITALAALSLDRKPNMSMLQFKGLFPSMDQCRIISLVTFVSRLFSAEDKNELRESFIRDAVSFCSLYFLGDYVAKGTATLLEKMNKDVKLLNRFTKPDKNAKLHDKIQAWTKDTDLKSFDEIKGKKATNLRSVAQAAGIAFSIIVLGIILPFYNRKITEKKVRQQKEMEAQNQNNNIHA